MATSIRHVQGCAIHGTDGDIGKLDEVYFEDNSWTIRYLVVQTGSWLLDRRVLISPISVKQADWQNHRVLMSLTCDQILNSPDIDTDKPVSRQHEIQLADYYGWQSYYWMGPRIWGPGEMPGEPWAVPIPIPPIDAAAEKTRTAPAPDETPQDTHLRSSKEVIGYHVHALDGEIGHIQDFLFEERTWHIDYMVVDTSDWWFGKKVVISPASVQRVEWLDREVVVNLKREIIRNSPEMHAGERLQQS